MRTSLFETLTGPLCDAALERDDSGARLLRLERENMLVQALDHRGASYRVHPLFRETLRAALEREYHEEITGIHRRAARWFGEQRDDESAVAHALAGRDPDWAAAYVWSIMVEWLGSGRARDLERVVGAFDADARAAHPELEGPPCLGCDHGAGRKRSSPYRPRGSRGGPHAAGWLQAVGVVAAPSSRSRH